VGRVLVAGVVALEQLGEAPVQLDLGVVRLAALEAGRVVPALDPQDQHRDQVALQLGRLAVPRAAQLPFERPDNGLQAVLLSGGHHHRAPPAAGQQPARRGALGRAEQQLVAEAHQRAVRALSLLEDVHLAAAYPPRPAAARRRADDGRGRGGSRSARVVVAVRLAAPAPKRAPFKRRTCAGSAGSGRRARLSSVDSADTRRILPGG
jgi:hypothetical protein